MGTPKTDAAKTRKRHEGQHRTWPRREKAMKDNKESMRSARSATKQKSRLPQEHGSPLLAAKAQDRVLLSLADITQLVAFHTQQTRGRSDCSQRTTFKMTWGNSSVRRSFAAWPKGVARGSVALNRTRRRNPAGFSPIPKTKAKADWSANKWELPCRK